MAYAVDFSLYHVLNLADISTATDTLFSVQINHFVLTMARICPELRGSTDYRLSFFTFAKQHETFLVQISHRSQPLLLIYNILQANE